MEAIARIYNGMMGSIDILSIDDMENTVIFKWQYASRNYKKCKSHIREDATGKWYFISKGSRWYLEDAIRIDSPWDRLHK